MNWPFRGLAAWLLAKWACFPGKPQDSGQTLPAGLPETGLRLSPLLPATCGMGTLPLQEGGTERSHSQAGPEKKRKRRQERVGGSPFGTQMWAGS